MYVSHSVMSNSFDLMDCSPRGSSVHEILQARILEWVAIPFSGYLPDPGIKPGSFALQEDSLSSEPPEKSNICITYKLFHTQFIALKINTK